MLPKNLFECSWEVCNKVGGINTVIKSKAELMTEAYENYFLVGPYFKAKAELELEQKPVPKQFQEGVKRAEQFGMKIYFGNWRIKGSPQTFLIDFSGMTSKQNEVLEFLWNNFQVDSYAAEWDYIEPCIWSYATGILIKELNADNSVAHFHEWLSGAGLLYLEKNTDIGTVFTTHATMLGRSISGSGGNLYDMLPGLDPAHEAIKHGVRQKHSLERASAQNASVFTTVSETTGIEAEKILGRKPEVLVLNGLDLGKFPTIEETSLKHVNARNKLREYLAMHFFPYYEFNLDRNLSFFYVGRYEYHNKGIDIIVESLAKLNDFLKNNLSDRSVSFFFWVLRPSNGIKDELIENRLLYRQVKDAVESKAEAIKDNIVKASLTDKKLKELASSFLPEELVKELEQDKIRFKREGNPAISTHDIGDEQEDILSRNLRAFGLDNKEDDPVKVIINPAMLDGHDGLINLSYFDAMAGCHLGIFPSFYEPWGYTPLESAAIGCPAITSDLSGFGKFIEPKLLKDHSGLFILHLHHKKREEIIEELFELMKDYCMLDRAERVQNKINAKQTSIFADWKHLVKNYQEAHEMALKK